MSLNERLAELCGFEEVVNGNSSIWYRTPEGHSIKCELGSGFDILKAKWNPTTDLNQLRMCYEALTLEQKQEMWRLISFWAWEKEPIHLADIFENPVDYAQAIIKAKGVSM